MDDWEDEFIPTDIKSRVLQYDPHSDEKEEYAADLNADNNENKLHYTMSNTWLNDFDVISGCLYTDADYA